MNGIKKTTGDFIGYINNNLSDSLSALKDHFNKKFRIKGRIRLLNQWASRKPERLLISFLIAMGVIFTVDVIMTSIIKNNQEREEPSMLMVDPIFDGMRRIETNRENIRSQMAKLVEDATVLNTRLDSLNNIPEKTPEDSLQMKSIVNQLKLISNILSYEKN